MHFTYLILTHAFLMHLFGFVAVVLEVSHLSHWSFNNAVMYLSKAIYLRMLLIHNVLFYTAKGFRQ